MGDTVFFGVSINNDVSYNWNAAFMDDEFIKYILVSSYYTGYEEEIPDYRYYETPKLCTATFPNCYKRIGSHAFENCPNLFLVRIPISSYSSITHEIGEQAFANCSNLSTFIILTPRKIGKRAFYNCYRLSSIVFWSQMYGSPMDTYWLNDIDDEAFMNCMHPYLATDVLGYVNRIGKRAFYNHNYSYPSVGYHICRMIDDEAFKDADAIVRLSFNMDQFNQNIPNVKCKLGNNIFKNCFNLSSLAFGYVDSLSSTTLGSLNVVLKYFAIHMPSYFMYSEGYSTTIGSHAFENYVSLSEVYISCIDSIGEYAFYGCIKLEIASIGFYTCQYIGDYAFFACQTLSEIFINNNGWASERVNKSIKMNFGGNNIFSGCPNLSYINLYACGDLPSGFFMMNPFIKNIGIGLLPYGYMEKLHPYIDNYSITINDRAFMQCSNLTGIYGPAPLNVIGKSAFYECSNLSYVNVGSYICTKIDDFAFYNCANLKIASFGQIYSTFYEAHPSGTENPKELSWYELYKIYGNDYDFSLTQDETVSNYKSYYIKDFESLSKYRVSYIGSHAFHSCVTLSVLNIGYENVSYIGDFAFFDCHNLSNGNPTGFPGVKYVGEYAYAYCNQLITIQNIGASGSYNAEIGAFAFYSCTRLKFATIGASKIGSHAFEGCFELEGFNGPYFAIKYIDEYAFAACSSLSVFNMAQKVEYIGPYAFIACNTLSQITLTQITSVPILASIDAFDGLPSDYKVIVPSSLYDNMLSDSVWGLISNHIMSST